MSARYPRLPVIASRSVVATGLLLAVGSVILIAAARPEGVTPSRDAGAPTIPLIVAIGPALVGIALALMLPPRRRPLRVRTVRRTPLVLTTLLLGALALSFPVAVSSFGLQGEDYVLAKALLFIVLPLIIVVGIRRAVTFDAPRAWWRWWAPLVVILVWIVLRDLGGRPPDYSAMDATALMIAATATAITAGFGEELFYRRLLQTRLEALLGPWAGATLASIAFALMHLGSHATGEPIIDVASVIVVQGSFGLLMGVLWMRYRNLTAIVVAHVLANGWHQIAVSVLQRSA